MTISPEDNTAMGTNDEETSAVKQASAPFVGGDIPADLYGQIGEILQQKQNFALSSYKDLCMKRRIAARIRSVDLPGPEPYLALLRENSCEQEQLVASLSIHVSQFFRNPSTFAVLEKAILPELLQRTRDHHRKLRVWSIGCANGEEPYSLALLCRKLVRADDLLTIIGTDVSRAALQRAKRGSYPQNRIAGVPEEMLQEYFTIEGAEYLLSEQIRHQVRFFRHDISSDQPFYRADLILCRNVLIYFSRAQQRKILQILAAALPYNGYLVLGRAETLVTACRELFRCVDPAERIYQRLKTDEKPLPLPCLQPLRKASR